MRRGWVAILAIALSTSAGCATVESGPAFDRATAESFTEGTTLRQQIEAALGRPTSVTTTSDGRTILIYSHVISRANGLTGSAKADGTMASFVVDAHGVLVSKTVTTVDNTTRAR